MAIAAKDVEMVSLREELDRLKRGKKRRAIPNPNRRFMQVAEALAAGDAIPEAGVSQPAQEAEEISDDNDMVESEDTEPEELPILRTRSGRVVKRTRRE
jgi:hypothetical protein